MVFIPYTAIDSYTKSAITCSSAILYVRFTSEEKKIIRRTNIFWDVTPCSLLDMYQSIGEACWPISRRNSKSCTLKVKAARSAETSVHTHQITWHLNVRACQITWRIIVRTHQVRRHPVRARQITRPHFTWRLVVRAHQFTWRLVRAHQTTWLHVVLVHQITWLPVVLRVFRTC